MVPCFAALAHVALPQFARWASGARRIRYRSLAEKEPEPGWSSGPILPGQWLASILFCPRPYSPGTFSGCCHFFLMFGLHGCRSIVWTISIVATLRNVELARPWTSVGPRFFGLGPFGLEYGCIGHGPVPILCCSESRPEPCAEPQPIPLR